MLWRNWRVILVVLLANYLVFSLIAAFVLPVSPVAAPTHVPKPTFTRSVFEMRSVGTLTYDFLTPTATATFVSSPTLVSSPTITATGAVRTPARTATSTNPTRTN